MNNLSSKEKYLLLQKFIEQQDIAWANHRRDLGVIGRFFEDLFGSEFAHQQRIKFKNFCTMYEI